MKYVECMQEIAPQRFRHFDAQCRLPGIRIPAYLRTLPHIRSIAFSLYCRVCLHIRIAVMFTKVGIYDSRPDSDTCPGTNSVRAIARDPPL